MSGRSGSQRPPPTDDTPVESLYNISAKSGAWLRDEGVATYGDLVRQDLVGLWLRLKSEHRQVTRLMYYALWGAVHDCHWNRITQAEKDRIDEVIRGQTR